MNLSATATTAFRFPGNEISNECFIGIQEEETSASIEDEQMSASIKSEDQEEELMIEIKGKVESDPTSKCCIYKVPKAIRKINKKAYTPQLVSIGPLHYGKVKLADMEKQKEGHIKSFFDRLRRGKDNEVKNFVQKNEQLIRDSYAETIELDSPEFVKMIMYDAIFIIEHMIRTFLNAGRRDVSWPYVPAVQKALKLDFQLLENQLPYFILNGIFNLACEGVTFMQYCQAFFGWGFDWKSPVDLDAKHFTDAIRTALVKSYPEAGKQKGRIRDLPCAMELHESGVKFKSSDGKGYLDVRFEKAKGVAQYLKRPELHIPCFFIFDSTECLFRNVMALEQCLYPYDTKVCNYIRLLDSLINTEKDVELLVARKIISHAAGDNAEVANMVNKLCSRISLDRNSSYLEACKQLKDHCQNPWNKTTAALRRIYFSNLWTGTATVAAVLLLILAAIQAICSIFQVT